MIKPTYEGINYLDQCAGLLKEFGAKPGSVSAESPWNNTKRRNIGCLLSDITEKGFPYYFTEFGWGYDSNEEQTVEFVIEDNQTAKLYSCLIDVAEWMGDSQEFNLDHPEFLNDYLHFLRNVKESELELHNKRTFSANEVFEGLFIGYDLHNSETITLFSDEYLTACGADAVAFIHAILDNDIDTLVDKGWGWCEFAEEARKSSSIAKKSKKISENDIGIFGTGTCINFKSSARYTVVEDDTGNVVECDIVLFLRVRNTFSTWWAWNYLQNTLEGEALLSKLISADCIRSWKTILRNTNIFGPTTRITQIKEMLELSFLRKHFDDQMSHILYRRSPVSAQKELILRQVDLANKALVTHMGDIERFVSPLPAFFEHPLHSLG